MSTQTNNPSLIERLFSVGAHFGFKKSRRHPTVTPYLFSTKEGNDIFDLETTSAKIAEVKTLLEEAAANGKVILFVGTKTEVVNLVKEQALKAGLPYVVNRWIGGMLTNLVQIKRRIMRMDELEREQLSGELERKYTKKERLLLDRELTKLRHNFEGIRNMVKTPDILVVVDPRHDAIAVKEARSTKVPVVAIMGSDCDVSLVNYPIPVNDALQASVKLILGELTDSIIAGKAKYTPKVVPRAEDRVRSPRQ